jgi:alpha-galactosidase
MFDDLVILFTYIKNGDTKEVSFRENHIGSDFKADVQVEADNGLKRLKLILTPFEELRTADIRVCCSYPFGPACRVLINGYQSWSSTREYFTDDKMKGLASFAAPLKKTHKIDKYGDYTFYKYPKKKGYFHGYTYGYIRTGQHFSLIGSLTEKNGFTVIEYNTSEKRISIAKECEGLAISTPYDVFDLIWAEGSEAFVFDTYFDAMQLPISNCEPANGWNGWTSWYNYYQKISEAVIMENLENILKADHKPGIFQIDDGFQTAVGDWLSIDADKFPNGMKHIADGIKAAGLKAGLWLAPFICEKRSMIYREKKDWLLKDSKGAPVAAGFSWSGFYALDFYNCEVREYIRKVFSIVLDEWGYDLVKLDFLYAVCLIPRSGKTRGTIMTEAMQFLRECVGDRLIIGCGVPLGPSFGLVDYCRIGCDIGLDWDDNTFMQLLIRERVSTRNAIYDTIVRRQLNGRAFLNDPDVFLLRDSNLKLNKIQKRTLFTVNYLFGSLLFTSDNTAEYNDVQWELFNMTGRTVLRVISKVEHYRNGLIEVFFKEEGENLLALINLGKKKVKYIGGPALGREIIYDNTGSPAPHNGEVELKACETRLFRLI